MDIESTRLIAAAIALFSLWGVGLGLGNIFSSLINSIARNPSAKDQLIPVGILGFAMTESIALFALVVALIILFK